MYISRHIIVPPLINIVADSRMKSDAQLDEQEFRHTSHVLDLWRNGKEALGTGQFKCTQRIALFEYGQAPDAAARQSARDQLRAHLLLDRSPRVTCLLPTPGENEDGETQQAATVAWAAFHAPDALHAMRGCFYAWSPGRYVVPLFPDTPWLKQLQRWQQAQWLNRAFDVAGGTPILTCHAKHNGMGAGIFDRLDSMTGKPLAIDIESIEGSDLITAVGISDGHTGLSVQWDRFRPYGCDADEPGIQDFGDFSPDVIKRVKALLAADTSKVFHNYTFDVPRLRAKGLHVGGPIHDTFAAHAIAYPELLHGLQHACASVMAVRPWKSLWHPKLRGITRDDIEYWTCDPVALRDYNADDAFHTWHLAKHLLPCVGVPWS